MHALSSLPARALVPGSFITGSDVTEQVKTLLDNGIKYASDHNLQIGRALAPEAVAELTKPVVLFTMVPRERILYRQGHAMLEKMNYASEFC